MAPDKTTQEMAAVAPRAIPMTPAQAMQSSKKIRASGEAVARYAAEMWRELEHFKVCEGWKALGYKSFKACVEQEFDMSLGNAYRYLDAAKNLCAVSDMLDGKQVSENTLRPLSFIPDEQKREVFATAKEESGGEIPTKSKLKEVADRLSPRGETRAAKDDLSSSRPDDPKDVARARKAGIIPEGVKVTVEGENEPGEEEAEAPANPDQTDEEFLAECPVRSELSPVIRARFDIEALAFRKATPIRLQFTRALRPITNEAKRMAHHIGPWLARIAFIQRSAPPQKWLACKNCKDAAGKSTGEVPMIGPCNGCGGNGYYVP